MLLIFIVTSPNDLVELRRAVTIPPGWYFGDAVKGEDRERTLFKDSTKERERWREYYSFLAAGCKIYVKMEVILWNNILNAESPKKW